MPTLHIEHRITDFDTWRAAFDRFGDARRNAGVQAHQVRRPIGDPNYIVIDLEFATAAQAEGFLGFLQANVWSNQDASPALDGAPQTMVLEPAME